MVLFVTLAKGLMLAGLAQGVYMSFKTLRTADRVAQAKSGSYMLMFWTVLSFLAIHEQFTEGLVSWLPLYYPIKCAMLVGLLLPQLRLPRWFFKRVLQPCVEAGRAYVATTLWPRIASRLSGVARVVHVAGVRLYLHSVDEPELRRWEEDMGRLLVAVKEERVTRRNVAPGDGAGAGGAGAGGDLSDSETDQDEAN